MGVPSLDEGSDGSADSVASRDDACDPQPVAKRVLGVRRHFQPSRGLGRARGLVRRGRGPIPFALAGLRVGVDGSLQWDLPP